MLRKFIYLTLTSVLSAISCVTPVDFTTPATSEANLVVDGRLTQLHERQQIRLYSSLGINQNINNSIDANITLFENGIPIEQYKPAFFGGVMLYEIADTNFVAKIGGKYHIRIETKQNGKVYESAPQELFPPIPPDSVTVRLGTETFTNENDVTLVRNIWQVFAGSALPDKSKGEYFLRIAGQDAYLFTEDALCQSHRDACYIVETTDPTRINLLSSHLTQANRYDGLLIAGRNLSALELRERQLFGAVQYRIGPEAYDFWSRLKATAYPKGTILDGAPASVRGNVYDVATREHTLGVFEVASAGSIYTILSHGDLPPGYDYNACNGAINGSSNVCCSCQSLPGSSLTKPAFWK